MLALRFDGLFREIPTASGDIHCKAGWMCYGWLIYRDSIPIAQGHGAFAHCKNASSNTAEYLALIEGLDALLDLHRPNEPITVYGDAKSVIDQMCGSSQVNANTVRPLHLRALKLAHKFNKIYWEWLPRKKNRETDQLTRRALRQLRHDREYYQTTLQTIEQQKNKPAGRFVLVLDLRIYSPTVRSK